MYNYTTRDVTEKKAEAMGLGPNTITSFSTPPQAW